MSSIENVNQAVVKSSRARPVKFLERGTDSLLVMSHELCRRPYTAPVDSSHQCWSMDHFVASSERQVVFSQDRRPQMK